ncbi:MAG: hypothetical protein WBC61_08805, partial [Dehalococcoidia bacterium]
KSFLFLVSAIDCPLPSSEKRFAQNPVWTLASIKFPDFLSGTPFWSHFGHVLITTKKLDIGSPTTYSCSPSYADITGDAQVSSTRCGFHAEIGKWR